MIHEPLTARGWMGVRACCGAFFVGAALCRDSENHRGAKPLRQQAEAKRGPMNSDQRVAAATAVS